MPTHVFPSCGYLLRGVDNSYGLMTPVAWYVDFSFWVTHWFPTLVNCQHRVYGQLGFGDYSGRRGRAPSMSCACLEAKRQCRVMQLSHLSADIAGLKRKMKYNSDLIGRTGFCRNLGRILRLCQRSNVRGQS
eukprot:jgi/Botrbrau1/1693/Bobra.116_2s0035.1